MTREALKEKLTQIRHYLHSRPETAMEEYETAAFLAQKLEELGCTVTRGVGGTGVVATLKCGESDRMVGLRSDIDGLPLTELGEPAYRSQNPGKFHGCGHDGHMTTLLGAAMLLAESRDFDGTAVFVFQPGEEPGLGAKAMIADGLFERFPMQEIYGLHNMPLLPLGTVCTRAGTFASSEDDFWITVKGKGGHASAPQHTKDPLVTAAEIILQLQTVISRNLDPLKAGTISCCDISTDGAMNAIPSTVKLLGDCRTYDPAVQEIIENRMRTIVQHVCEMNGCEWELIYDRVFAPVVNDAECAAAIHKTAESLFGSEVCMTGEPLSFSEDFAEYQKIIPGAFCVLGTKPADTAEPLPLHNARFDYNDDALVPGALLLAQIIRDRMPL